MITKTLTVLAVHGDVDEAACQAFIDSQHELNSKRPENGGRELVKAKAVCSGLIVATLTSEGATQEEGRIEIPVNDFGQMAGVKVGGKLRMTLEPVE